MPPLTHKVIQTDRSEDGNGITITPCPGEIVVPTAVSTKKVNDNAAVSTENSLDFALGMAKYDHDIYVYSMQANSHQQDLTTEPVSKDICNSSDQIPPRILQSVHGYFNLRLDHPTRLNLSASWDKTTVSSLHILFTNADYCGPHVIFQSVLTKLVVNFFLLCLQIGNIWCDIGLPYKLRMCSR